MFYISEDDCWCAEHCWDDPNQQYNHRGLSDGALVLRPHWKHHKYTAVHTDDDQDEDAAVHVDELDEVSELAHEGPKDPVIFHLMDDAEGQGAAEYEVRYSQTQVPDGDDRLLHPKPSDPDHQTISSTTKDEDECIRYCVENAHWVCA